MKARAIGRLGCAVALVLLILFPVSCAFGPDWSLPLLLWNLPKGGWTEVCADSLDKLPIHPDIDPPTATQFTTRLSKRFPPGSSETKLVSDLHGMGFLFSASQTVAVHMCLNDSTVHEAVFVERGFGPYLNELVAVVYWKTDRHGGIVWVKGWSGRKITLL